MHGLITFFFFLSSFFVSFLVNLQNLRFKPLHRNLLNLLRSLLLPELLLEPVEVDAVLAEELLVEVEDGDLVAVELEPLLVLGQGDVDLDQVEPVPQRSELFLGLVAELALLLGEEDQFWEVGRGVG